MRMYRIAGMTLIGSFRSCTWATPKSTTKNVVCSTKPWNSETVTQRAYFIENSLSGVSLWRQLSGVRRRPVERGRVGKRVQESDLLLKECFLGTPDFERCISVLRSSECEKRCETGERFHGWVSEVKILFIFTTEILTFLHSYFSKAFFSLFLKICFLAFCL